MTRVPVLLSTLLSTTALAQDLTIHDGWLLEPQPGTVYENGIGSPTVAYDRANDLWVMYFETQIGPADPAGCKGGVWGVGRATSPDGLAWTIDPDLVLEPVEGTYYSCSVAHPEVVYDGTTFRLWFKGEQRVDVCDDSDADPSWGCRPITGVGYATSTDGLDWVITPEPVLNIASFGFPTVAKVGDTWRMLLAFSNARNNVYELWESVSQDDALTWSPPEVVVRPGFADWVQDEIYNPALTCRNDEPFSFVLWTGGRDTTFNGPTRVINTAGLGRAFSENGVEWPWDADNPYVQWDQPEASVPQTDWRHWDSVRIKDDYLIYFSQKNAENHNRIGLAYTYPDQQTSFHEKQISDRICSTPEEQDTAVPDTDAGETDGDTDDTDHGGQAGDTDTGGDSDATGTDKDDKCGCDTGAPAGLAWVSVVLAAGLRRRRRTA